MESGRQSRETVKDTKGDSQDAIPDTQDGPTGKEQGVSVKDGQIVSDSEDDAYGGTPSPREDISGNGTEKATVAGGGGLTGGVGMIGAAAEMEVSSPRVTFVGTLTRRGIGGPVRDSQDRKAGMKDQEENDSDGMQHDMDLGEDVYSYIQRTLQPWMVWWIYRSAIGNFRGIDRVMLHTTIVSTLLTMTKTVQHNLMSSIRT